MRQGSEDQLVETGADVSILPQRERILLVRVTEAREQLGWTEVRHPSSDFTSVILETSEEQQDNINNWMRGGTRVLHFVLTSVLRDQFLIQS